MMSNLARLLQTDGSRINVKARTHEKVDSVGECRALECHVVMILEADPDYVPDEAPVEINRGHLRLRNRESHWFNLTASPA